MSTKDPLNAVDALFSAADKSPLPDPNLSAKLTYAEWCVVLHHLGGGAFREVGPVIERLMAQLSPQADAQQQQAILAVVPAASDLRN